SMVPGHGQRGAIEWADKGQGVPRHGSVVPWHAATWAVGCHGMPQGGQHGATTCHKVGSMVPRHGQWGAMACHEVGSMVPGHGQQGAMACHEVGSMVPSGGLTRHTRPMARHTRPMARQPSAMTRHLSPRHKEAYWHGTQGQ